MSDDVERDHLAEALREIKFRTWIVPSLRMADVIGLCYQTKGVGVEVLRLGCTDIDDPASAEFWWKDKEAILRQYTGLHDRKDVEIYEGDIALSYNIIRETPPPCHAEVYMRGHCWHIRTGDGISTGLSLPEGEYGVEVVGNIYENRELLEVGEPRAAVEG